MTSQLLISHSRSSLWSDLNRVHNLASSNPSSAKLRSRVLIFSICPDQSSSYVSMMNGIFSTQKQSIPVDACVLTDTDSLFLQQASYLTKGVYGRVPLQNQHALLQYLMVSAMADCLRPSCARRLILLLFLCLVSLCISPIRPHANI